MLNKENICQQLGEKEQEILKDLKAVIKAKKSPWLEDLQSIIDILADNAPFVRCMGRETLPGQVSEEECDAFDKELSGFFRRGKEKGILQGDFSSTEMNDIFFGLITGLIESMSMRQSNPRAVKRIAYDALLGGIYSPLDISR